MGISKTTHLYEVLLRFGPDGLVAAHQKNLERVADDETGQVYFESETLPVAITARQAQEAIGKESAMLTNQIAALAAERDNLAELSLSLEKRLSGAKEQADLHAAKVAVLERQASEKAAVKR